MTVSHVFHPPQREIIRITFSENSIEFFIAEQFVYTNYAPRISKATGGLHRTLRIVRATQRSKESLRFHASAGSRAVRLAAVTAITRPARRGAARRDCGHNPKKTEGQGPAPCPALEGHRRRSRSSERCTCPPDGRGGSIVLSRGGRGGPFRRRAFRTYRSGGGERRIRFPK